MSSMLSAFLPPTFRKLQTFGKFTFLALMLSSCVDKIELPPPPDHPPSAMLVQGKFLFGDKGRVTASVFELYTAPNELPKPIGGAQVALQDDQGHQISLLSNFNGNFYLEIKENDPNFPVQVGRQYRLHVSLPSGQVFQSEWETLMPLPPVDDLRVDFVNREVQNQFGELENTPFARFSVSTGLKTPGTVGPARFRWEFDQSYRITDDLMRTCYTIRALLNNNVTLLDGALAGTDSLAAYSLFETPVDYRFAEGYYLILYQQSISNNALGYFSELNQLLAKKGTLFDPPAGEIRSNISSPTHPDALTYGFFYVASQDTARLYVSPEMAGNPRRYCPLPPSATGQPHKPNACDDCLLEAGDSRLEKPDWWEH